MKRYGQSKSRSRRIEICTMALLSFSVLAAQAQSTSVPPRSYAELSIARIQEISAMLNAQPSGFGRPCSDRAAWAANATRLHPLITEAYQIASKPLPPFDERAYLQFVKTGDRQAMESNLHSRMDQLAPLVLAECVEYKSHFLPRIAEVMDSLAAMPSWTLSASDPQLVNLHGVRYYVDLNAADLSDSLAEALFLLGDRIPAATRNHVLKEMDKHVFAPTLRSFEHANGTADDNWWLYADMNWNAVCLKGVTGAALAVLPREERAVFVAGAEHYIQHYEAGFNPDGYDTEGLGYWNYGFSHFLELRENLLRATGGRIDLLATPKMQKVALFGLEFPMMPGNAAAFGDAGVMPVPDAHLIQMLNYIFQIHSAQPAHAEKNTGVQHGGLPSIALDLFPVPGDKLTTPLEFSHHELQTYFADSGVLVSRPAPGQDLAVTIKAGGNTSHSHNDIGSFVIGLGAVQPVGDPGGPRYYTGATFGPNRLDSRLLNSFGHPVPEIDGHLQLDASGVDPRVLSHSFSQTADSVTIDMTGAYSVPSLRHLTRTLLHQRAGIGSVKITDSFDLKGATAIVESLPTHGTWEKIDSHTLLFRLGAEKLRARIDAPVPITVTETRVDDYGNPFTRVEVHIPLAESGKVTMLFMPVK